ncbi:hypothetical protein PMAYCL1PPCAC_29659, partial [Pristionchus mayeri]
SPLLLLLPFLFSLLRADSQPGPTSSLKDWEVLKPCRDCMAPTLHSPGWMGVDIVKYTNRPCKFIECDSNYELWVNGNTSLGMNKLKCFDGRFRPIRYEEKAPDNIRE